MSLVNLAQAVLNVARWLNGWGGVPAVAGGAIVLAGLLSSLWGPMVAVLKVFGPKPKAHEFNGGEVPDDGEFAFGVDRLKPKRRETISDFFKRFRR